jgi:hypothetical protein
MSETNFDAGPGPADTPALGDGAAGGEAVAETDVGSVAEPAEVQPRPERMVSLAALHAERSRRKQIDQEYRRTQQELAELRGKFSVIESLNLPSQGKPADEPTPESDIVGYAKKIGETVEQVQKRLDDQSAAEQASAEQYRLVNAYRADAARFEAQAPDFRAAYDHLLQSRAAELQAIGYTDPQILQEALQADEFAVAHMALSRGQSPAELLYALAQQRGYRRADGARSNGAARLQTIERGQAANKSLSNTGGAAGEGEMTAEQLIKMPMDEFEAWCTRNPVRARRLMGG